MDVHTSFFVGVVTKLRSWCSELKVKKKKALYTDNISMHHLSVHTAAETFT